MQRDTQGRGHMPGRVTHPQGAAPTGHLPLPQVCGGGAIRSTGAQSGGAFTSSGGPSAPPPPPHPHALSLPSPLPRHQDQGVRNDHWTRGVKTSMRQRTHSHTHTHIHTITRTGGSPTCVCEGGIRTCASVEGSRTRASAGRAPRRESRHQAHK